VPAAAAERRVQIADPDHPTTWHALQTVGDILVYPPRDLRKKLHESKSQVGGVLTVLLPIALAVAFGVMYGEP